jgi:hypothetical protein
MHGVKVSYAAIRLARTLGERGVSLWLSDDGRLGVRPASELRVQDRDAIRALWRDLAVIALADETEPAAEHLAHAHRHAAASTRPPQNGRRAEIARGARFHKPLRSVEVTRPQ